MADTFTYDISTEIGKLRFNIGDTDLSTVSGDRANWSVYFTDAELAYALEEAGNDRNLASYKLLTAMASNRALLSKKMRAGKGAETDAASASKELREMAKVFLEASREEGAVDEVTPVTWNDFSYRQRLGHG